MNLISQIPGWLFLAAIASLLPFVLPLLLRAWRLPDLRGEFGGAYNDLASGAAILKEVYDGQIVEFDGYVDNPAFAMVPKATDFYGEDFPIPLAYGTGQGRSSNFTNAQANQSPTQYAKFRLTRKRDYAIGTVDNETAEASENTKGAFESVFTDAVDKQITNITNSIASAMFRSGTGSIGLIATGGITSGVITLDDPSSVSQFELNMVLQANATDGGASPRSALGYVIARDVTAGTVTVASSGLGGSAATPTSWAAGDYLLVQGDLNSKISGFPAWLLNAAPSGSDNFYGVNRSADRWRLAGGYYNGAAQSIEEAATDAMNLLGREGGSPNVMFTNFGSYSSLEKSLGAKVIYNKVSAKVGDAEIGFEGIKLAGQKGAITVIPDRNCPEQTAHLLTLKTWKLRSLGECPKVMKYKDTNLALRVNNADAMEFRIGYYANLGCNAPGWNAQILLGA